MTASNTNTMTINGISFPIHTGTIKPDWIAEAAGKGFDIVTRVADRFHLALRCRVCGGMSKVKLFTLRTAARPLCSHCLTKEWVADAQAAGLEFLRRDPANRHYGIYLAECGHELSRQFALVKQAAEGSKRIRCGTCQSAIEHAEACARGWTLVGPDPAGNPNYRAYRHEACGHVQRMARVNLQSGRHSCGGCGVDWPAAPSHLYAMMFTVANGRELVKIGYSNDPEKRLRYHLQRDREMPCEILRTVAVPTGQEAIRIEKGLHAKLRREHSECVVAPEAYRGQIRVQSEIYDGSLTNIILAELAQIEAQLSEAA
ncbi:GIY-YIG nuclease family protein [Marivita sp. GX14005]|uniref:GIY-YIG nuclease family protein n=1 Tax=Marivita sp. GX14005 TaxID=2942276 RepID=UPI002018D2D7|nr:GIY-YIG nuclease family protein [Marivita sp. GX14005]MCL3882680.1 GIY-YIG nuclease family protein [Marivita sp. GX14005]